MRCYTILSKQHTNKNSDEAPKLKQITNIVYFCGQCNLIIGNNLFCKACEYQYEETER